MCVCMCVQDRLIRYCVGAVGGPCSPLRRSSHVTRYNAESLRNFCTRERKKNDSIKKTKSLHVSSHSTLRLRYATLGKNSEKITYSPMVWKTEGSVKKNTLKYMYTQVLAHTHTNSISLLF